MVRENCIAQPWIFVNQEVICDNARLHNNIKRDYGWCLSVIINESYQKMVWDPEMEVPRSTWNFRELIYTFKNCLNFLRNSSYFREVCEKYSYTDNYLRDPETVWGSQKLFETTDSSLTTTKTIWDFQEHPTKTLWRKKKKY